MYATRSGWLLRQLEVLILCRAAGLDEIVDPLTFCADTDNAYEFERDLIDTARGLLVWREDERVERAANLMAQQWVRVRAVGVEAAGEATGRIEDGRIRLFAGVDPDVAVLAAQAPGADIHSGGNVHLSLHGADTIAAAVAAALPSGDAGTLAGFSVVRADLGGSLDDWDLPPSWMDQPRRFTPRQLLSRFLGRPTYRVIEVTVSPGAAVSGWKPNSGQTFHIYDTDAGRFLVRRSLDAISVGPADAETLIAEIQQHVHGYLNAAARKLAHGI